VEKDLEVQASVRGSRATGERTGDKGMEAAVDDESTRLRVGG